MEHQPDMDLSQMAQSADRASALMKTLGHRDRLMILCQLAVGEKSVREAQTIYYSLKSGEASKIVEVLYELFCEDTGCAV